MNLKNFNNFERHLKIQSKVETFSQLLPKKILPKKFGKLIEDIH